MARLVGIDEGEGQRTDAELGGEVNGLAIRAGHPEGRVRLLHRFGHDVADGHGEVLALEAGVGVHHHHVRDLLDGFPPHGPALRGRDPEAFQLGARGRLARAEIHASLGDEVQGGDALGDSRGVVVARRHEHDAVPEPDLLGALGGRGEEHLGRG